MPSRSAAALARKSYRKSKKPLTPSFRTQLHGPLAPQWFVLAMPRSVVHYPGTSGRSPFAGFDGSLAQTGAVNKNVHSTQAKNGGSARKPPGPRSRVVSVSDWGEVSDSFPMDVGCCKTRLEVIQGIKFIGYG